MSIGSSSGAAPPFSRRLIYTSFFIRFTHFLLQIDVISSGLQYRFFERQIVPSIAISNFWFSKQQLAFQHKMNGVNIYDLHRYQGPSSGKKSLESLEYSSNADSESYYYDGTDSSMTGHGPSRIHYQDATDTVHEMHLALLYLLSNPDEFQKALKSHPPRGATTLSAWNAEYDDEDESVISSATATATPLPFVVFADDAEVVLPQAHTASQLFGIERVEGIELEAAAGIPALSQLFLRWLGE